MSSEIRQNKVTKEWVIFAPNRGKRPHDFQEAPERPELPPYEAHCPFCAGNEHMLSAIVWEKQSQRNSHWQTRIVPNKYPALTPEGSTTRSIEGLYVVMEGFGHHDVIIESPRHNQDIAMMPIEDVGTLIETYHQRYVELRDDPRNVMILIFRNHGQRAGASLVHPHSQLITTGIVPRHTRWREDEAQRYFDEWGRCVYCDIVAFELGDRERVVLENESFIAFVPFAAEVPFETWIVPKQHQSDFGTIGDAQKTDLTSALHAILSILREKLNDPDYNYVINTAVSQTNEPYVHWYVRIRPRLITRAGFEIGSGIRINPSLPEADAALLRGAIT